MRLAMPDGCVTGVTLDGVRTGRRAHYQGRIVDVDHPTDVKTLRDWGAFPVNQGGRVTRGGYRCPGCGFAAYVVTCSRCGATCEKEN